MALSNEDWIEIFGHTRRRVRDAGFGDLDEQLTLDFRASNRPQEDCLSYLSSLISGLTERSYSGYKAALETLREFVQTENGEPIEGIDIRVSDADFHLYRSDSINLEKLTDLTPLIKDLRRLKNYLAEQKCAHE